MSKTAAESAAYKRAWRAANRERCNARARAWSAANKEKVAAATKKYRFANPRDAAYHAAYYKKWYAKNKEAAIIYVKQWRAENKAKADGYVKKWKAANREAIIVAAKKYRDENKVKVKAATKLSVWRKQGLDPSTFPPQSELCDVCGSRERICMDHCHEKIVFRGWLCNGCNAALGFAKDNPATLRALADYLERKNVS
jgi:hypothetical protein